jgi:hypothetical protein
MTSWDEKVQEFEDKHGCIKPLVLGFGVLALLTIVFLFMLKQDYNAFMEECRDDGLKRYECNALWRGHASVSKGAK